MVSTQRHTSRQRQRLRRPYRLLDRTSVQLYRREEIHIERRGIGVRHSEELQEDISACIVGDGGTYPVP